MGILICNTRTDGENPNVLGAIYDTTAGKLTPKLAVAESGNLPTSIPFMMWDIVQAEPGGAYHLKITGNKDDSYFLAVPLACESGSSCHLIEIPSFPNWDYCALWMFPYPTRLISANGIGAQPTDSCLCLDAGHYPNPMVWSSTSSVNQTWMYGSALGALQFMPPLGR